MYRMYIYIYTCALYNLKSSKSFSHTEWIKGSYPPSLCAFHWGIPPPSPSNFFSCQKYANLNNFIREFRYIFPKIEHCKAFDNINKNNDCLRHSEETNKYNIKTRRLYNKEVEHERLCSSHPMSVNRNIKANMIYYYQKKYSSYIFLQSIWEWNPKVCLKGSLLTGRKD